MAGRILWEAFVALFAAFGLCCALGALLDLLFQPRNLTLAVEIRTREDADMLDMLLHEAGSAFFCPTGHRITVLISSALLEGTVGFGEELFEEYRDLLARFGAEWYPFAPREEE